MTSEGTRSAHLMLLRYVEVEYTEFYKPHPYPTYNLEETGGPEQYLIRASVYIAGK